MPIWLQRTSWEPSQRRIARAPHSIWNEARKQYDEEKLSGPILAIASVNVWNRLNAAARQVAGSFG